ncbi:hypothetical protein MNAN1_000645 [Malassezia nana]|uniref:Mannose-P-dolichol utilization defect 1 protein homolog n=1 Tax=Malassezia nana TaxID=180528 RepID=A0AAF0EMX6_9BASI|nr:hypothetical protein MNAN1_000645 [Malassezia nana]
MAVGLQHLTRSLPWFLLQPAEAVLGTHCYTSLVWDVNWTDTACLRLGLSKGLGLGIVVFGSLLKFPQMYKIVHAKSAEGISLAMYILEVVAYTISLAYAIRLRIPFSTYGENASLTVQNMIITLLIIVYSPMDGISRRATTLCRRFGISTNTFFVTVAAALMVLGSLALASETTVPPRTLSWLQGLTIPVSLASKVPQMLELHRAKATGELSILVVFAQLMGTAARVYTTLTETNDRLLFWGFALATIFNAVIAAQVCMYWNGNQQRAAQRSASRWLDTQGTPTSRRTAELPLVAPRATTTKRD